MAYSRQPHQRRSYSAPRTSIPTPPPKPVAPVVPLPPPRRRPLPQGLVENLCYENGVLKSKPDCRAVLINHCILEDDFDIDEAEDATDRELRERNLWNEPSLDEILYGNTATEEVSPSDPEISSTLLP